jgi:hypothetical protein
MRGQVGCEGLVQAHEQSPGDTRRRRGERDHDAAQHERTPIEKHELGEA